MPDNSPKETPTRVPRNRGRSGKLRTGNPGNKGGGRTPDEFKAMCRQLASSEAVRKAVAGILKNRKSPLLVGALKWASEHGYGAPQKSVDVTSKGQQITGVVILPGRED